MVTMQEEFYRIKRLPPYVFAEVNALKARARAAGRDVIDLGMGNPDGQSAAGDGSAPLAPVAVGDAHRPRLGPGKSRPFGRV